ncbi:MAG: uridine phosphorylase [Anaerolineaceae bacterium]|nr:uridine phosphorylase [Anaerolineaceae bacterium]
MTERTFEDSVTEQATQGGPSAGLPLLAHALDEATAFRPDDLVAAVRQQREVGDQPAPALCVLEFDGDLTDKLIARGQVRRCEHWPCFHTEMWLWPKDEPRCGIVARTIGGPYTVLVAEQMAVCGAKAVIGLASAGRVGCELPLPAIVVADEAVRDEGTSLHYLPPSRTVRSNAALAEALTRTLATVGLPVRQGLVWTTDAPYRETRSQIEYWAAQGALAVEMQAASLLAFGRRCNFPVGLVAHVTNAADHGGEQFHKGPEDADVLLLKAICSAMKTFLAMP